jgi:hypothetical protein
MNDERTEIVKVKLDSGREIGIEVRALPGERRVASNIPHNLTEVMDSIEDVARLMSTTLEKVKPNKAAVEFGLEISADSGALTALIVKGSGKANLKITLEWS